MRLQGSQTRLGGDISRVRRESAGDGRKSKSVGKQGRQGKEQQGGRELRVAEESACVRARACERAALGRGGGGCEKRQVQSLTAGWHAGGKP
jgi:hypothetical protein